MTVTVRGMLETVLFAVCKKRLRDYDRVANE